MLHINFFDYANMKNLVMCYTLCLLLKQRYVEDSWESDANQLILMKNIAVSRPDRYFERS